MRRTVCSWLIASLSCLLALWTAGCKGDKPTDTITLATTTSTRDTGLLDVLLPRFRQQTGIEVKVVSVGTGQALELGRRGDADVLLVHAPAAEQQFMDEGHGSLRKPVMYNDFVLVGPENDPAKVEGEKAITAAFTRIAQTGARFISRGDESGTHHKEREIWQQAGIEPAGRWYRRAGSGMAEVLRMASEKPGEEAYTLTDRGTLLAQRNAGTGLKLRILSEGDPLLFNPYSVILVNPEKHPHVRRQSGEKLIDFLLAPDTRKMIAEFGKTQYGQPLFFTYEPGKEPK